MKAERRHELKHNELADWLGEWMEAYRPHVTGISIGAVVLLGIVLVSLWLIHGASQSTATAWTDYFRALNDREPEKTLEQVATTQVGSQAAWWALLGVADMNLAEGAALLHSDRAEAQKRLEKAERTYKQLLTSSDPQIQTLAELGLARVYESLCKPAEAAKHYQAVADREKETALGALAREGLQRVKNPREVSFLEWFAQQTPRRPSPLPGVGGAIPGLPGELPSRPDLTLPATETPATTETPTTPPATPSPASANPADTSQSSEGAKGGSSAPAPSTEASPSAAPQAPAPAAPAPSAPSSGQGATGGEPPRPASAAAPEQLAPQPSDVPPRSEP
jgi:predicted negative regulator of RcsB-dependent stress response